MCGRGKGMLCLCEACERRTLSAGLAQAQRPPSSHASAVPPPPSRPAPRRPPRTHHLALRLALVTVDAGGGQVLAQQVVLQLVSACSQAASRARRASRARQPVEPGGQSSQAGSRARQPVQPGSQSSQAASRARQPAAQPASWRGWALRTRRAGKGRGGAGRGGGASPRLVSTNTRVSPSTLVTQSISVSLQCSAMPHTSAESTPLKGGVLSQNLRGGVVSEFEGGCCLRI
jgi:hypothetical protein